MHTLTDNAVIHRMKPDGTNFTASAASTAATSDSINMLGFVAVVFMWSFGAIVSGAATSIKIQHSDDNVTFADVAGTSQTVVDTADNGIFLSEIFKPTKQYLRVVTSRATQNATVDALHSIQHLPIHSAPTQSTTVAGRETFNSPVSGVA